MKMWGEVASLPPRSGARFLHPHLTLRKSNKPPAYTLTLTTVQESVQHIQPLPGEDVLRRE
jgi:hypothetical protein